MKSRRKIKRWIFLLFITTFYLTTSTYAWFSTNRSVYVSDLRIKVRAQGGIEVSSTAKTWNTVIDYQDIISANKDYPTSVNQLPNAMEPVSTGKTLENGFLKMYYGYTENSENDYLLIAKRNIETEGYGESSDGKFIAFDIFLKSEMDANLYLSSDSGANYLGEKPGIENSVRYAFLLQGTVPIGTSYETVQKLKNATEETTYIWEPNYDVHTENGVKNALNVYGINVGLTNNQRVIYDGIVSDISESDDVLIGDANSKKYSNLFKTVNIDYETKANNQENKQIFPLKKGITKIRVYIWIEGQDIDCENNSSVGDIDFNFQFTTNPS